MNEIKNLRGETKNPIWPGGFRDELRVFVGTRSDHDAIKKLLNRGPVAHLNQETSKSLRQACNYHGIKQTEKGARLEFYIVTPTEYDKHFHPDNQLFTTIATEGKVKPLVTISGACLAEAIDIVNEQTRDSIGRPWGNKKAYKNMLVYQFAVRLEKIGDDVKPNKRKDFGNLSEETYGEREQLM